MKNKFLFLLALLFSTGITLNAQNSYKGNDGEIAFGPKAGINISNVWDSQDEDFDASAKIGFAGGFFLGIPIGEYLGFQPEVMLSQKGFHASGSFLGSSFSFTRTSTFIDVPLQLQIRPVGNFAILVGPQYSFLVHEKNVQKNGLFTSQQEQAFENDNIRKNILGFVTGFDFTASNVVFSGRVGWDVLDNKGDGTSDTPRYKNTWLQLAIGFSI